MLKRWLLALTLPVVLGGCYVAGRGQVAYAAYDPPPPRTVQVDIRPGYFWVDGFWTWGGNAWAWRDGYYAAERPGYVWMQGSWYGRQWRPGYWNRGRGSLVDRPSPYHRQPNRVYVTPSRAPARLHVIPPRHR